MRSLVLSLGFCALAACATTQSAAPAPAANHEGHTGMQPPAADATGAVKAFDHKPKPGEKAICAVSGEAFTVTEETKTAEYQGKYYAFCCDMCAPDFAADPAKYAK